MLAKADRLDGGGSVEGYYSEYSNASFVIQKRYGIGTQFIDPQTLKYSFNNGESWFSEREVQLMIKGYKSLQIN